ncbi:hypothetical protein B0H14DRAFT_2608965 [Mycena olivaceomarginata]|nr:hypothetical protein B0H14DRAFT_2608965 [Mycena olivaceomarginata]
MESRTLRAHFVHQRSCLRAVARDWRKAVNSKSFLWNTWDGTTRGSIERFDVCTSRFGPGPVDLRLQFKPGPAYPGKVSTPDLLELINTVSEQCATLKLFMIDDIDTADIIFTVHSNQFPRLSNLSITVLYWKEPSYDGSAPETPCPTTFAHFPNTLKDLRLNGYPVPWTTPESFALLTTLVIERLGKLDSPTVGEFEALLNAASNLERLSLNCVRATGKGATRHSITMNKLHTLHYCPIGHRDLGSLITRIDAPNLTHLELDMYTTADFEILEQCWKTFRFATNMTIGGFKFTTAVLGAICEIFPLATHIDLTLASWFLILVADASVPIWPKLVQLRIEEPALGELNKMVDRIAIERLEVYCRGEACTAESIMTNIRKLIPAVVVDTHLKPKWHSVVSVSE